MLDNSIAQVVRSQKVLRVRGSKSQVSRVFFIRKTDGTETMKRDVRWVPTSLLKPNEIGPEGDTVMSKEDCPLYYTAGVAAAKVRHASA